MVYKFRGTVVVGLMVLFLWMGSTDAARPEPTTCTTTHLGQDRLSTQQQQQQQHCRITMAKLRAGSNSASLITDTDTDTDEEENYYKSRDDWWKDPLAMFDESDDQVETQVVDHRKGNPASSSSSNDQQQQDSQQLDSVMEANITTKSSQQSNSMQQQQQQQHDDDDYFLLQQEEEEEEEHVDFAIVEKNRDTNHQTKPKQQQQRRRRRPTPKVAGPVRQTKQNVSSSSSSGVTTLPAPLAKSLTDFQALVDDKPVVQILTAVAMTKYVGGLIRNHVKKKNPKEDEMDGRSDDEMVYDDDDEVMEEEEEHARYAYTRASRTIYDDDDDDEEEEDATQADDEANEEPTGRKRRGLSVPQWVQSVGKRIPLPGGGRRVILQELEELKEKQKAYERERADLSADCEQARHKLSEAQSELAALSTTTRYLKAQLRDNEQSLDQAVVAEQTKAKMELTKMKDAMLRVLEKERRAMREELRRRTNELQAMMEASNQEGDEIEM